MLPPIILPASTKVPPEKKQNAQNIATYNLHNKTLNHRDADDDSHLENLRKSIVFVRPPAVRALASASQR